MSHRLSTSLMSHRTPTELPRKRIPDPSAEGTPPPRVDFSPKRLTKAKIFRAHILLTNLLVYRDGLVAAYRIPFITSSLAGNLLDVVAIGFAIYPVALA